VVEPLRTCVGCRERAPRGALLRVVARSGVLVADPSGREPGRGAHLHPDEQCLGLARRRNAFPRALRVPGPLDDGAVQAHVEAFREREHSEPAQR
jgi:predicted RNA-binding protein YlxR (DUF448 family)